MLQGELYEGYGQWSEQSTFYNYNSRGELTREVAYAHGATQSLGDRFREYSYDDAGNRSSKREVESGFSANGSHSQFAVEAFSSNALNQYTQQEIEQMWRSFGGIYDPSQDANPSSSTPWIYQWASGIEDWWGGVWTAADSNGKRHWSVPVDVRAAENAMSFRAHWDAMHEKMLPGSYYPPRKRVPSYDNRGNMTSDGYLTYTYDAGNRLVMVTDGLLTWRFLYDPWGRRIRQQVQGWFVESVADNWQFGVLYDSKVVYEGWHPIMEIVVNTGNGSSTVKNRFYWGPDVSNRYGGAGGIGGLLMVSLDGESLMVGYDGSGNVTSLVDMVSGELKAGYEYDAFGQPLRTSGALADKMPLRYQTKWSLTYMPTSKQSPEGTPVQANISFELYDYGLRWYHPGQGRFINRDPIGEAGGLNLYAFVNNDPVNRHDVLGLSGYWNEPIIEMDDFPVVADVSDPPTQASTFNYDPRALTGYYKYDRESVQKNQSALGGQAQGENQACNELRNALTYAKLAKAGYPGESPPDGWGRVDPMSAGIPSQLLHRPSSGYDATIFQNYDTGKYVISFAGTNQIRDFTLANIPQNFALSSDQYRAASMLGNISGRALPGVTYVGHSLGGGLASGALANSSSTGGAYIFNAAGLNPDTLRRYGGNYDRMTANTQHWFYFTDPLTSAQASYPGLIEGAAGNWNAILDTTGSRNPLYNHSIDTLIKGIESEMEKLGCK
ncbi:MAG: hypothetical protein LR015_01015 [Verrucomicrobia bacterium]|nr:hypothetical protein [Verrucomicrobiota bacterium]